MRRRSRWTAVTVAAVVVASAASRGASGLNASAASRANSENPAASENSTAGQRATTGPGRAAGTHAAASDSPTTGTSASPIGLYTMTSVPYTATGPGGGLHGPQGISASDGVVYVSNTGANVVAAIKNGQTTLVAGSLTGYGEHGDGGRATSATLSRPTGTAEDAKGDLFIADSGDNVIREVTPNGIIHRFAGTGMAGHSLIPSRATMSQLDNPQAVAVTPKGDLLIADTYNNRVLLVTPAGRITVVAGDGRAGYKGDGGPATSARLNGPQGIAVNSAGDLFIADTFNSVIRGVNPDGVISTAGEIGGPDAVAVDPGTTGVRFYTAGNAGVSSSGAIVPPIPYGTPVIDGQQDAIWSQSPVTHLSSGSSPISADVRLMWDDNYLYYLAEINDSTPVSPVSSTGEPGNAGIGLYDDSSDVWINWSNSASASYTNQASALASHYVFTRNDVVGTNFPDATGTGTICPGGNSCALGGIGDPSAVKADVVSTSTGYTVEAAIPWPAGVSPQAGAAIGFTADVNDFTVSGQPRTDFVNEESTTQYWITPVGLPFVVLGK
jgi:hypothetical protein